jgi:hypothetical protein
VAAVKAEFLSGDFGMPEDTVEQVTEDTKIVPQALKRLHIFSGLAARLKSGASPEPAGTRVFRKF